MKTYQIAFKYETWATYEVQADGRDEAENLALEMLKRDEGEYLHCGSWTETEIEEMEEVLP